MTEHATDRPVTPRVLVLYASTHGHTGRIARRLAEQLSAAGVVVELRRADGDVELRAADYDGVVVGASVHAGRHQSDIVDWIEHHPGTLNDRPTAFFSVSLTAADDTDEARMTTQRLIDDTLELADWHPTMTAAFAGALQFREYNLPTRVLMRLIARQHDQPVDVHQDLDFTDWAAVDAFADAFAAVVVAPVLRP